jgi:hypothetical protein
MAGRYGYAPFPIKEGFYRAFAETIDFTYP